MNTTKFNCRFFYGYEQLEKYIEINSISREEIYSISPYSAYHGNGNSLSGHYLYFFTHRSLLVELFPNLNSERQKQITNRLENVPHDKEFLEKIAELSRNDNSAFEKIYNRNVRLLTNGHKKLLFRTDSKSEPTNPMDYINHLIQLNPDRLSLKSFYYY